MLLVNDTILVVDSSEKLQKFVAEYVRVCEGRKLGVNVNKRKDLAGLKDRLVGCECEWRKLGGCEEFQIPVSGHVSKWNHGKGSKSQGG